MDFAYSVRIGSLRTSNKRSTFCRSSQINRASGPRLMLKSVMGERYE